MPLKVSKILDEEINKTNKKILKFRKLKMWMKTKSKPWC